MSNMFYSHSMLSKKGALGTIWVAAHCQKRLKKELVLQTNISSSVDKILLDEAPTVTYRILAFLLLGVVRIYSKKVEYLFHDSRHVLADISHFSRSRKTNIHVQDMCAPESSHKKRASTQVKGVCAPYSGITLPKNFDLDSFNLETVGNESSDHQKPHEEIMLDDALETHRSWNLDKGHGMETSGNCEDPLAACPSSKEKASPPFIEEHHLSHNLNNLRPCMGTFRDNRFSLDECLDPMILYEDDDDLDFLRPSVKLPEIRCFSKEDGIEEQEHGLEEDGKAMKPSVADIVENGECEEQSMSVDEEQQTSSEKIIPPEMTVTKNLDLQVTPDNRQDQNRSADQEQHTDVGKTMLPEMATVKNVKLQLTPDNRPVSVSIDMTPVSMVSNVSGSAVPEFMAVRTPAAKERTRTLKKRKCEYDDMIVLPNKVFKQWVSDSSDLVCKRRKAPQTARNFTMSEHCLKPIISNFALDFESIICKKKLENLVLDGTAETPSKFDGNGCPTIDGSLEEVVDRLESHIPHRSVQKEADELGSHVPHRSMEEEDIAPSTPVTNSTSLRFSEIHGPSRSDGAATMSSFESGERTVLGITDGELHAVLTNEEFDSLEVDSQENHVDADKWSARTRTVASYLHRNFLLGKKRRDEEVVNLSRFLKSKSKKESARFFYELLVLKTGGYIEVKQEKAYDEIYLMDTWKLKKACEGDGR